MVNAGLGQGNFKISLVRLFELERKCSKNDGDILKGNNEWLEGFI